MSSLTYPALDLRRDKRAELRKNKRENEKDVGDLISKSAIRVEICMENGRGGILVF